MPLRYVAEVVRRDGEPALGRHALLLLRQRRVRTAEELRFLSALGTRSARLLCTQCGLRLDRRERCDGPALEQRRGEIANGLASPVGDVRHLDVEPLLEKLQLRRVVERLVGDVVAPAER